MFNKIKWYLLSFSIGFITCAIFIFFISKNGNDQQFVASANLIDDGIETSRRINSYHSQLIQTSRGFASDVDRLKEQIRIDNIRHNKQIELVRVSISDLSKGLGETTADLREIVERTERNTKFLQSLPGD